MSQHSIKLNDLAHLRRILSWYDGTFGKPMDYDIQIGGNPFLPKLILMFKNEQEKMMYMLRFGIND